MHAAQARIGEQATMTTPISGLRVPAAVPVILMLVCMVPDPPRGRCVEHFPPDPPRV